MPSPSRLAASALLAGVLIVWLALPALAVETSTSELVLIREGTVFEDDLYAATVRAVVEGELQGDLVVFAADEVVIRGKVTGSLLAIAPTVRVEGTVEGSVRVAGGRLIVTGEVGEDVVVAATEVALSERSRVGGDVLTWTVEMSSLGRVEGALEGSQRSLYIGGEVGEVDIAVGHVDVAAPLRVLGDFDYRSDREVAHLERAQVEGTVVRQAPLPPNLRIRALRFVARLLTILVLTTGALAVAWAFPDRTRAAIDTAARSPWRAWWRGALVLASPLVVAGLAGFLLVAVPPLAALSLAVILAPVVVTMAGVIFFLAIPAGVPAVGRLGVRVFRGFDYFGAVAGGSLLAGLLWLLPFIGWTVPLVVLPAGLGSWMLSWRSEGAPEEE